MRGEPWCPHRKTAAMLNADLHPKEGRPPEEILLPPSSTRMAPVQGIPVRVDGRGLFLEVVTGAGHLGIPPTSEWSSLPSLMR